MGKKKEKKLQKIATNKAKAYVFFGVALLLASVVGVLLFKGYDFESVSANPDYICISYTETSSCEYNKNKICTEESNRDCCYNRNESTHERECRGYQYTGRAYHSGRTQCANGISYLLGRDGGIGNGGWYGDNGVHISTYTIKDLNSVSEIKQVCLDLICSGYTDYSKSGKSAIYTGRKAHCLSLTKQIQFYDYYSTLTEDNINNIKNEISACETEFSDENLYQIAGMKTCVVTEYDTIAPTSDIVK